jgi:hypothetical protein
MCNAVTSPQPGPAAAKQTKKLSLEEMSTWPEWRQLHETPDEEQFEVLLGWLATKHANRNAVAAAVLQRAGAAAVPRLILEAASSGKQPPHRLRILEVIERIEGPLEPNAFMDLMFVAGRTRHEGVHTKVTAILRRQPG